MLWLIKRRETSLVQLLEALDAVREGLIDPHKSVQIGIRTTFTGETTMGFRIVYADEVHDKSAADIVKIIEQKVGKQKAYLTFDIDCLDPSAAPGDRHQRAQPIPKD